LVAPETVTVQAVTSHDEAAVGAASSPQLTLASAAAAAVTTGLLAVRLWLAYKTALT